MVTLYDFGSEDDGTLYIVMERLEGRSLDEHLPMMPLQHAVHVAAQILEALHAAHKQGLMHRDIKPENVMVLDSPDADGLPQARLLDFGIARRIIGADRLTRQGEIFGTPWYMSPEQARGSDEVDHRADIYAVGVILYEAVAGRLPFDGDHPREVLRQLAAQQARPLELRPGAPRDPVALQGAPQHLSPPDALHPARCERGAHGLSRRHRPTLVSQRNGPGLGGGQHLQSHE